MNPEMRSRIIEICTILAQQEGLKANLKHSFQNAGIVGVSSLLGSVLLGPVGLVAGAVVSSLAAGVSTSGKYQPAYEIIRDMSPHEQNKLIEAMRKAAGSVDVVDLKDWLFLALSAASLKEVAIKELIGFLQQEMGYQITH